MDYWGWKCALGTGPRQVRDGYFVCSNGLSYPSLLEMFYGNDDQYGRPHKAETVTFNKEKPAWVWYDTLKKEPSPVPKGVNVSNFVL